jgi:DNA-binding HxlR family transcriptional regulator
MTGQAPPTETRTASTWGFLTNHAHVLLCVARDARSRARDIAEQVGITERAAQRILADLIAAGYITRTKNGRRNHYEVDPLGRLRHPVFRDLAVGPLLELLDAADRRPVSPRPRPVRRTGDSTHSRRRSS